MKYTMRRLKLFHAADWLSLAAAPTFALMAVVTGVLEVGAHQMTCSATMHMSALTGMVPMYVLMSGFHFTPWLKLISCRAREPQSNKDAASDRAHDLQSAIEDEWVQISAAP